MSSVEFWMLLDVMLFQTAGMGPFMLFTHCLIWREVQLIIEQAWQGK